jgi:DNA mismatch repair protein MutS2
MNIFLDEVKKKEKGERQKAVKKVEEAQETVTGKLRELDIGDMRAPSIDEIKKGDVVYIRSLGHDASVIEVNAKNMRVKVSARNMEIEVPLTDVTFAKRKSPVFPASLPKSEKSEETIPLKIKFVGLRVDEALSRLERFLNDASLAELPEAIIVHGIGKGLLSKAIHEHLNGHPLIKKYRSGTLEEGGAGVTIVTMN